MEGTRVVRMGAGQEPDVYIGRGGRWGNPYRIGPDGDRQTVIAKFERLLCKSPSASARYMRAHIHELHGKRLGCFCAPLPCHGDVLAKWAEVKFNERIGASA